MSRTSQAAYGSATTFASEGSKANGILCALLVVVLFAGFTLISRLGLSSSALKSPDLVALRFGIGGLILLPVFLKHGLSGLAWYRAAGLAFAGGLGFALFAYSGFYLAPASHGAVLLHGTLPLTTFAIVYLTSREQIRLAQLLGLSIIAFGIVAMAWDSLAGATPRQLIGDGALLVASICWSSYGVAVKRLGLVPLRAASIVAFLSMCCFLPIYLLLPDKAIFTARWQDLLIQAVFQGVFIGAVSIYVFTRSVALLGAKETALFIAAVPCITTAVAIPMLSEMPGAAAVVGVVLVTMGMVIAMRAS